MRATPARWIVTLSCLAATSRGSVGQDMADAELKALAGRVPGFRVVDLPKTGRVKVSLEDALTVEKLRGVVLDEDPPVPGAPAKPYDKRMGDTYPPGEAPYAANGIKPFRFRYFNNEFSYGGWHNFRMQDYASGHGFNVLYPYNRKPSDWSHAPKGSLWLRWGGFVNWTKWLPKHGLDPLRYDRLTQMDVRAALAKEKVFKPNPGYDQLMIDMEHPRPSLEKLREQPWYPRQADRPEQEQFEKRYYDGYALTYVRPIEAARRAGWRGISVYGWQPFGRRYWGLDKARVDPATDWAWHAFGRQIYDAVDILNPSVYCFYWSQQNVAYTLANIDLNMELVKSMPARKPVRPYYWTLLHGGGGGERWWKGQPIRDEDVRAMTAFCFFTGCDGLVLWNWSGTGNHHRPAMKPNEFVMVDRAFEIDGRRLERYDVLHISDVAAGGTVRFQVVEKGNRNRKYGLTEDKPTYEMARDELALRLRPQSAPVAAMVEGLALVRPLEYLLRHGDVKIDVSAQQQFAQTLPIVRRVTRCPYHVVGTYDPTCVDGGRPRSVVLANLDGRPGLTLELPADSQTRLFVLR